ncbi:bifunctional RecB family nuclease/DEAD/DEAH box helicase [Paeniglutamicibacter sp. Y32M11]|uniref:TM0106 family RecB-like putative nuclease n=1 Tax=Paeniglutamicibacter sp. Y32M11 TaxID=2853258 RepID=UPI001C529472|nr:bifunctional RecB family nuclease/DEAD/DEAH box helicase [Paeniglutamicibacter sp. Y32M11]QXQ10948.1 TM0106 family RecB-like putative nuclease [Paeniglutamicibacter sp. Y32M11]
MFFLDQDLIYSASDLVVAASCEFASLSRLDERLGRSAKVDFGPDEMLDRTAVLGDAHEHKVLEELRAKFGDYDPASGRGVKMLAAGVRGDRASLQSAHDETLQALVKGADVVFQATFFDGEFVGFADFLIREDDGSYAVWDTKLARHARVTALLQLAAYGDQLITAGIPVAAHTTLVLGDKAHSVHQMHELLPVFKDRRARFKTLVAEHRAATQPVAWGQDGIGACGRCDYCSAQVIAHRDLLLVAGMSTTKRKKLMDAGITSIDALAASNTAPRDAHHKLAEQARMQVGLAATDGTIGGVAYKIAGTQTISRLPLPDAGDIFFDFEGDPLWQDPFDESWGLEYLFGIIEIDTKEPVFKPFWAHSRAGERKAFTDFVAYVEARRAIHPKMKIYHYAAYEKSALRNLSLRHVVAEDTIDAWLRDGLLVDLYDTVRHSLLISERSYSIKKLEPLYMGEHLRGGDVKDAGASVVAYARYNEQLLVDETAAQQILESIRDYNEYDCLSTLRLRDWLLGLVEHDERAEWVEEAALPGVDDVEPSPEEIALRDYLEALPQDRALSNDERAIAMVAAATGYHRREAKQFWWEHFDRLEKPFDIWADTRNVFVVDDATVVQDWHKATARAQVETRVTELSGSMAEGSDFRVGSSWFAMYANPLPPELEPSSAGRAGMFNTVVRENDEHIVIAEKSNKKVPAFGTLPVALTPDQPINTTSLREALAELARSVGGALPSLPKHPGIDILRKTAPRFKNLSAPPRPALVEGRANVVGAIVEALIDLDHSYLAVQGPPGTGKTYVASHVIAALVKQGWKVGVVAQSHAVVDNVLTKAITGAGVHPEQVAKKLKAGDKTEVPWSGTTDDAVEELLNSDQGALIGGTAWTMTGKRVPEGSLDLLVIDEAGQYSLANTLAVSRAATRLLLLGDPQQLPQVTQGSHPQPVDESALGWLSAGHPTLPEELGYFLADSWRMHPELCSKVSALSYESKLQSAAVAATRSLAQVPAGVATVLVEHRGNTTASLEEAHEVINQVHTHLGLSWIGGEGQAPRPLVASDILVVAAYNAQVNLLRTELDAAALEDVKVGTVDKFQGQEAPVVIVSMACSSADDAARGIDFLLNRNRINVAVSRGQWRAVIVRSPALTHFLPSTPAAFAQLGAFLALGS